MLKGITKVQPANTNQKARKEPAPVYGIVEDKLLFSHDPSAAPAETPEEKAEREAEERLESCCQAPEERIKQSKGLNLLFHIQWHTNLLFHCQL